MDAMAPCVRDRTRGRVLPALDALALGAFTVVGVANHDGGLPAGALARVGLPLLAAWFVAAWAFGTYRVPGVRTLLLAWASAVPVAVLVRTIIAGGPWDADLAVFLGVALAFSLLFLVAARGLARALRLDGPVVD
jgi:hypothetical protein